MSTSSQQLSPAQINQIARSAIKARAVPMLQQIFASTYGAAAGTTDVSAIQPVVNVQPRNVGLIRGFWVKYVAIVNNGSGQTATLSDFGPANLLSQILFNDLNNNTRIQTTGWHVDFINSIKARRPFGSSMIRGGTGSTTGGFDSPINYGSNFTAVIAAPATIANGASAANSTITMWWYVPLAYSPDDLRGSVYANVVNATMQLNLTLNPTPFALATNDNTSTVYSLAAGATVASCVVSQATITVYQDYLDQLPVGQGGVILPVLDLATIYELKNTVVTSMVANQDFPVQYSNFRDFLSTIAIYVSATAGTRGNGSDINTWALQSANFTNIWKLEPGLIATRIRNHLGTDMPPGTYYFGSREKPISTTQYGNMQLVLNAKTVTNSGAYMLLGYEDLALVQTLNMAGSLAAS